MQFSTAQLRAVLLGGVTAGVLDLLYAMTAYGLRGVTPQQILQSIASGWLGRAAYQGGLPSALLGALSHFVILCVAAAIFVAVGQRLRVLLLHPLLSGAAFGVGIFVVMNYVVVPLSAAATQSPRGAFLYMGIAVHVTLVGMPIAWFAQRGVLSTLR